MKQTVLVVEDQVELRRVLRNNLEFVGYRVLEAGDGRTALEKILRERPGLVVLDIGLPVRDGLDVLREVRGRGLQTPVLFLTARAEESDRIAGFDIGADDYVTKPFSVAELLARVRAILRRAHSRPEATTIRHGPLEIDLEHYTVTRAGNRQTLSFFEAEILRVLLRRPGEVVSRTALLDEVWGVDCYPTPRAVDNHIGNLRKKIEKDPHSPRYLLTAHRVGYRFVPEPPDNF